MTKWSDNLQDTSFNVVYVPISGDYQLPLFDDERYVALVTGTYIRLSTDGKRPSWYVVTDSCTLQRVGKIRSAWLTAKKIFFVARDKLHDRHGSD